MLSLFARCPTVDISARSLSKKGLLEPGCVIYSLHPLRSNTTSTRTLSRNLLYLFYWALLSSEKGISAREKVFRCHRSNLYAVVRSGEAFTTRRRAGNHTVRYGACIYCIYGHKCIYLTAYYLRLPDCKCLSTYLCVLIVELRFPGLLTLFFPRYLQAGKSASLSMEWWGDSMRYQVCMGMLNTRFFTARFKHCIAYRLIDASAEKETGQRERSSHSSSQVRMNSYVLSCFLLHIFSYFCCFGPAD